MQPPLRGSTDAGVGGGGQSRCAIPAGRGHTQEGPGAWPAGEPGVLDEVRPQCREECGGEVCPRVAALGGKGSLVSAVLGEGLGAPTTGSAWGLASPDPTGAFPGPSSPLANPVTSSRGCTQATCLPPWPSVLAWGSPAGPAGVASVPGHSFIHLLSNTFHPPPTHTHGVR